MSKSQPYNLTTISYKSLFKIYQVLENIKIKSEIKNSYVDIHLGDVEQLESGLPTDDHRAIINHLLDVKFIRESCPIIAEPELFLTIEPKEFFDFYDQVIAQLKKLKVIEEKQAIAIGAKPQRNWADIQIKFLNAFDVEVTTEKGFYSSDCEKLGFSKTGSKELKPVASWNFLKIIAKEDGSYPLGRLTNKEKEQVVKHKQDLTKRLKSCFQIDDDPFYEYDSLKKQYRIKLKLIKEPVYRKQWADKDIHDEGIIEKDYVEKQRDKYYDTEKKAAMKEIEASNKGGVKEYLPSV